MLWPRKVDWRDCGANLRFLIALFGAPFLCLHKKSITGYLNPTKVEGKKGILLPHLMVASTLFLTWGTGGRTMTVCAVGRIWLGTHVLPTLLAGAMPDLPTTR